MDRALALPLFTILTELAHLSDQVRSLRTTYLETVMLLAREGRSTASQIEAALGRDASADDVARLAAFRRLVEAVAVPTLEDRVTILIPLCQRLRARGAMLRSPVRGEEPVVDDEDDASPADAALGVMHRLARLVGEHRLAEGSLNVVGAAFVGRLAAFDQTPREPT